MTKVVKFPSLFPIGYVLITVNNVNPKKYFGGTWEAFGSGRCLVGVDTSQTEFSTVKKTGGSKTHTLSVDEMPKHAHGIKYQNYPVKGNFSANTDYANANRTPTFNTGNTTDTPALVAQEVGSSAAHNNLQPYITVYFWVRTA